MAIIATIGQYFRVVGSIPITASIVVTRLSNSQYAITGTATIEEPAIIVIGASILIENFDSIGTNGLLQIGISEGATSGERVGTFNIAGSASTTGAAFDITAIESGSTDPYDYVNLPLTVTVPAFEPTDIQLTVDMEASRTAADMVRFTSIVTSSETLTESLSNFVVQIDNANGVGGQANIILTIPAADMTTLLTTTDVSLAGSIFGIDNRPYTVTVREHPAFPLPDGFVFANLPFTIDIPSF